MLDIIVEIVLDVYLELMLLIVPEKNVSKKQRVVAKLLAVLSMAVWVALAFFGAVLLVDYDNVWGYALLGIAAVFSIVQIILGIVLYKKNH